MEDLFISKKGIKKELNEIEQLGIDLTRKLSLLTQEIRYIIFKIKSCDNVSVADSYFDILQEIQSTLSALLYREEIGVSDILFRFAKDFDRIDDPWLRNHLFEKIKKDQYRL
jgi:hypothetical protein